MQGARARQRRARLAGRALGDRRLQRLALRQLLRRQPRSLASALPVPCAATVAASFSRHAQTPT